MIDKWIDRQMDRPLLAAYAALSYLLCCFDRCPVKLDEVCAWVCDRLINGGQLANGLAGPVFMAAPPLISATWFPANQRTTATSLGILSGNVGFALSFIIGFLSIICVVLSVCEILSLQRRCAHVYNLFSFNFH